MRTFEAGGHTWTIELHGLLLDQAAEETGLDLVEVSAAGLLAIETSKRHLCAVVRALCREQCEERKLSAIDFSKLLKGEVLESAFAAVVGSVQDFFPPNEWSVIQSNWKKQKDIQTANEGIQQLQAAKPLADGFLQLPPEWRERIIKQAGGESYDLQQLEALASAAGQESTPSEPTTDAAENSELAPASS